MTEDTTPTVKRRSVMKAAAAGATFAAVDVTAAMPGRAPGPKENEVLVGVSAGHDLEGSVAGHVPANADIVHKNETLRYVAVSFPEAASQGQQQFIDAMENQGPPIKFAEVNGTMEALFTPNDPRFGDQYAPQQVQADDAWDTTLGSGPTISVVDQGVQYDHPDLDSGMSDSESNHGQDFVDNDEDPYPDDLSTENHGTHVAGIAAAPTDNGEGVAGISNADILSARALNEDGSGSFSDIADAIEWSANNGADVINMSLGGSSGSSTLENAVEFAHGEGVYIVAAAGNSGPCSDCVGFPASYQEVVAVSAVDDAENLASFSSTGPEVELAAPGVDVLSTITTDTYDRLSGTSMATPVVSGAAAVTLSQHNISNVDLRNHLNATADDLGLGSNEQGNGQVNVNTAVTTDPGDGDDGDGGDGTCGANSTSGSVTDSLSSSFDADCWFWSWEFADPCQAVVELDGPFDADFDLYVNNGVGDCPSTGSFTHRSISTDSQETIVIDNPDTSTDLFILVDSFSGSGTYTLSITEKTT